MRLLAAALASTVHLHVAAAESMWGSIAAQLGGDRVQVTSIISSPAADPHDYEPTPADARALAGAQLVILNGAGYDPWAPQLDAANPVKSRVVLDVGKLAGVKAGDNPHLWYSPSDIRRVVGAIAADYARLDPKDAGYFRARRRWFETTALAQYTNAIATIRRRFGGTRVGASESIFAPLAQALGLRLVTPDSFLNAISEGAEPTASDITAIARQIAKKSIRVWVLNTQNDTPDVARLTAAARRRGIRVVPVTETLTPATATFEEWQVRQLRALLLALVP